MEDKYILEKEYSISADMFREAYRAYQKKFVYPKSYFFMAIFLILSADFIYAAFKDMSNYFAYILIVICLALAFREWYNPRRIRRSLVETVQEMGDLVYKIGVGDSYVDISTVSAPDGIEDEDGGESEDMAGEDVPEPTRIPVDGKMRLLEYSEFFLLLYGKQVFYIIPKKGFDEKELDVVRKLVPAK
ncbi:MAG: YcxB family protein [Ruminococcus sp.]|nr:YcxB family protein [Ruminococcus sp.]